MQPAGSLPQVFLTVKRTFNFAHGYPLSTHCMRRCTVVFFLTARLFLLADAVPVGHPHLPLPTVRPRAQPVPPGAP